MKDRLLDRFARMLVTPSDRRRSLRWLALGLVGGIPRTPGMIATAAEFCIEDGEPCRINWDCCSLRCRGGSCLAGSFRCQGSAKHCLRDDQCCTSRCRRNRKNRNGKVLRECKPLKALHYQSPQST